MATDSCPNDLQLEAIVAGAASLPQLAALHEHAAHCASCSELLAAIGRVRGVDATTIDSPPPGTASRDRLRGTEVFAGTQIGRFVVERELGRGGMGIVYAARDETLQRTVAIKLLRQDRAQAPEAVLHEARAMARVDHPNVVSVYEVSIVHEQVYLVMDYVDGPDLGRWLAENERPWPEVLRCYLEAARGLAALHAAGLVHRDFKPHNVLIGRDGRARVTDFGLVDSTDEAVSRRGVLEGTPRYMPPEQLRGERVTAASDQFALCVSLYEGLTRQAAFAGSTTRERLANVSAGRVTPPPPECAAPRAVLDVVIRGLSPTPEGRFADIDQLCIALERAAGRRRRHGRVALLSGLVAGALGLGFALADAVEPRPCETEDALAQTYGAAPRDSLVSDLSDLEGGAVVVSALDGYAERWRDARHTVCEAGLVRRELSDQLFDAMMGCLDQRRAGLDATLRLIEEDITNGTAPVPALVRSLDGPESCTDRARMVRQPERPEDPATLAKVEHAEGVLARVSGLTHLGRLAEARAELSALDPKPEELGYQPLVIEAMATDAELSMSEGRHERGLRLWEQAYAAADVGASVDDWFSIAYAGAAFHAHAGHPEVAELLLSITEAQAAARGLTDTDAEIASQRALLIMTRGGDMTEAEAHLRTTVELSEGVAAKAELHALACKNLGTILFVQGHAEQSLEWIRRAIDEWTELEGPDDPQLLDWQADYADVLGWLGRQREARDLLEGIVDDLPDDAGRARVLTSLGRMYRSLEDNERALEVDLEVLAILSRAHRETDPLAIEARGQIGLDLLRLDRPEEALPHLRTAARGLPWGNPSNGSMAAPMLSRYALALARSGHRDEAIAELADLRARLDADPITADSIAPEMMETVTNQAFAYEAVGLPKEMLRAAETATAIVEANEIADDQHRVVADILARAQALTNAQ